MKAYTDIEQSKKLAEILPIESADMFFADGERPAIWNNKDAGLDDEDIPCWSLAALLDILNNKAYSIDEDAKVTLSSYKTVEWDLSIINSGLEAVTKSDPIDACVEMIVKLKEKESIKQLCINEAYLFQWYQSNVDANPPIWTDEHLKELFKDFYLIPKNNIEL